MKYQFLHLQNKDNSTILGAWSKDTRAMENYQNLRKCPYPHDHFTRGLFRLKVIVAFTPSSLWRVRLSKPSKPMTTLSTARSRVPDLECLGNKEVHITRISTGFLAQVKSQLNDLSKDPRSLHDIFSHHQSDSLFLRLDTLMVTRRLNINFQFALATFQLVLEKCKLTPQGDTPTHLFK